MHPKAGLAALLAAAPLAQAAQAVGNAFIKNNCNVPIYLWATDIVRAPTTPRKLDPGEFWSEGYKTPKSGGVSLKLSKGLDITHITQFEYTLAGGFIWYDGSNVNCRGKDCPFYADGIHMETSNPSCPKRTCQPNQDCTGFYIEYNDDVNSLSCNPEADVNFYLCATSASGGAAPAAAAPAAATTAAADTTQATPSVASAASVASPSVVHKMEAPAAWKPSGSSFSRGQLMVKKHQPRDEHVDARDLHAHMRRHNHKRHI